MNVALENAKKSILSFSGKDTIRALIGSLSINVIWFAMISIAVAVLLPLIHKAIKNINKNIAHNKKTLRAYKDFKKVITYSYILIWAGIAIYSISLLGLGVTFQEIFSKSTLVILLKICSFAMCGITYTVTLISISLSSKSIFTLLFILAMVGSVVFAIFYSKKPEGYVNWLINCIIPSGTMSSVSRLAQCGNQLKASFNQVTYNIGYLLPAILLPSVVLALQIACIANIIKNVGISQYYFIPLIFLIDWAYNFSTSFTKYFTFTFIDKNQEQFKSDQIIYEAFLKNQETESKVESLKNERYLAGELDNLNETIQLPGSTTELKKKPRYEPKVNIGFTEISESISDLCLSSLYLTIFSIFGCADTFLDLFTKSDSQLNSPIIQKALLFLKSTKYWIKAAFHVAEFYSDEYLFNRVVLKSNLESLQIKPGFNMISVEQIKDAKNRSFISTQNVFRAKEVFLFTILSFKNLAIRFSLHSTVIVYFFLGSGIANFGSKMTLSAGSEGITLFAGIFKELTIPSVLLLIFYLALSNYSLAIEAAYIMNTKYIIESPDFEKKLGFIDIAAKTVTSVPDYCISVGKAVGNAAVNVINFGRDHETVIGEPPIDRNANIRIEDID